jgi:hypothetical protein
MGKPILILYPKSLIRATVIGDSNRSNVVIHALSIEKRKAVINHEKSSSSGNFSRLSSFTQERHDGSMRVPDKHFNTASAKGLDSKEGERKCLSGDITGTRSPSLDFNPNNKYVSTDAALDYLAEILVEIYLASQHANRIEKSSDLLPGLDQGTG